MRTELLGRVFSRGFLRLSLSPDCVLSRPVGPRGSRVPLDVPAGTAEDLQGWTFFPAHVSAPRPQAPSEEGQMCQQVCPSPSQAAVYMESPLPCGVQTVLSSFLSPGSGQLASHPPSSASSSVSCSRHWRRRTCRLGYLAK